MSDLDFCDDVKRSVTLWFHGHDMERIERAVTLISERFADRPPDFMPRGRSGKPETGWPDFL
jgi:hypothetical protein